MSAKSAYLAGLVSGDGHIERRRNRVDIRIFDPAFRSEVARLFRDEGAREDAGNCRVRIASVNVVDTLTMNYGIPRGKKSCSVSVPDAIRRGTSEEQLAYAAGWFDAEGWLEHDKRYSPPYPRIRFAVTAGGVAEFLAETLREIGIQARVFKSGRRVCLDVNGRRQVKMFFSKLPIRKLGISSAH